jgi:hypothetical protein
VIANGEGEGVLARPLTECAAWCAVRRMARGGRAAGLWFCVFLLLALLAGGAGVEKEGPAATKTIVADGPAAEAEPAAAKAKADVTEPKGSTKVAADKVDAYAEAEKNVTATKAVDEAWAEVTDAAVEGAKAGPAAKESGAPATNEVWKARSAFMLFIYQPAGVSKRVFPA